MRNVGISFVIRLCQSLLLLGLAGCSWFAPGSGYSPFPFGGNDYQSRECVNAYGMRVACDPQAYRDSRRCTNARGSEIYCRPGDVNRPGISGSGWPVAAPYQQSQNNWSGNGGFGYDPYGASPQAPVATRYRPLPRQRQPAYTPPPRQPAPTPAPETRTRGGFVLGVGDVINLEVYGQPDMSTKAVVSDSGLVTMPLLGPINVSGFTPLQAEQHISKALKRGGYLVDPQVNITLQEYRSRQVSVMGQVQQPGRITIERDMTLVDAISQASGTTPDAADFAVLIRESDQGPQRHTIGLRDTFQGRGQSGLTQLQDGDTIYIPEVATFYIYGQVNQPAKYQLEPGLTVLQALSLGGGLTELASVNKVTIRRRGPDGLLRSFQAKLDDLVKPADTIFVDEGLF